MFLFVKKENSISWILTSSPHASKYENTSVKVRALWQFMCAVVRTQTEENPIPLVILSGGKWNLSDPKITIFSKMMRKCFLSVFLFHLSKQLCGMDQFWGIALRAQSGDVSRAAIQYINSYYINGMNFCFLFKILWEISSVMLFLFLVLKYIVSKLCLNGLL